MLSLATALPRFGSKPAKPLPDFTHAEGLPIVVGRISGVYGVKGWVKIHSYTEPLENILTYKPWLMSKGEEWQPIKLESGKRHGKGIVAQLAGYHDRDQALALRGVEIAIWPEQRVSLEENEFYWTDLIGLRVINLEGIEFGHIDSLLDTGANDVLVVKGEQQRLVPYMRPQVVKSIDLNAGQMKVDWPADF